MYNYYMYPFNYISNDFEEFVFLHMIHVCNVINMIFYPAMDLFEAKYTFCSGANKARCYFGQNNISNKLFIKIPYNLCVHIPEPSEQTPKH